MEGRSRGSRRQTGFDERILFSMTLDIALLYGIILAMLVLFASDLLRLDLVALLALLALALTGILTPEQALAGFANPVVVMIAGLFIVGEGLYQSGVAARIARFPTRVAGSSETRLMIAIMVIVALLSAIMSSTGTVAVMLPVVMGIAWERNISPSRLLIPVAVASLLGGMLTLIGTPPNIIVSQQLVAAGREPFHFFSFTPVGGAMMLAGLVFMALLGRLLLPNRPGPANRAGDGAGTSVSDLAAAYQLPETMTRVRIPAGSPLVGARLRDANLRKRYGVTVADIRVREKKAGLALTAPLRPARGPVARPVVPDTQFAAGDILLLHGRPESVSAMTEEEGLEELPLAPGESGLPKDVGLVEVLLTPRSNMLGRSIRDTRFRDRFRVTVLAVRRLGKPLDEDLRNVSLRFGDTLLVKGPWRNIQQLQAEHHDFVVATRPRELEEAGRTYQKAPLAAAIMVGMLVLMTFGIVSPVIAVMLAAMGMVLSRAVRLEDAYRSIHWQSVVLIAAVLPMATALEITGGLGLIVDGLTSALGNSGPLVVLAALFILTSGLSQVISNTATAVLLAPIAVGLAAGLDAAPEPFLMGIAVAASTAFATPVASPVNVLVLGPGGYKFTDFLRIGLLLQLVIFIASLLVIPLVFPFG